MPSTEPSRPPAQRITPLVRLPFPQEVGSLTPYTFELGYSLLTLVYDTLLWRDQDGVPQPWLARSVDRSDDGRRITVHLADNARWHDGRPVTSADVAFTIGFVAERPHPRFSPQLVAVERVETPDPTTAVIFLRHPSPGFYDQPLADLPILPEHLWRGLPRSRLAPDGLPVGSGPYRLVEHRPGEAYRFEANRDYFLGSPAVSVIEVPVIGEAEDTLRALERRQVDMIPVNLPKAATSRLEGLGIKVAEGPSYVGTVLLFNLRRPPFDRPEVRRAIAATIDLTRITRLVGNAVPAVRGYLHPDSPWSSGETLHRFKPTTSSDLPAGLAPIEVMAPDNDPTKLETARQVALALRRAGMAADAKPVPRADLSRAVGEDGSAPSFGMAVWSSPPLASFDPDFLRQVFGSDAKLAPLNFAGYSSTEFDRLAQQIAVTADPAIRRAAVESVLRLLATDLPVLPLFFSNGSFAFRPAAFDGWLYMRGAGILDKRSFMASSAEPASPPVAAPDEAPADRPILGWLAIGAVAMAALLAIAGVAGRRRRVNV